MSSSSFEERKPPKRAQSPTQDGSSSKRPRILQGSALDLFHRLTAGHIQCNTDRSSTLPLSRPPRHTTSLAISSKSGLALTTAANTKASSTASSTPLPTSPITPTPSPSPHRGRDDGSGHRLMVDAGGAHAQNSSPDPAKAGIALRNRPAQHTSRSDTIHSYLFANFDPENGPSRVPSASFPTSQASDSRAADSRKAIVSRRGNDADHTIVATSSHLGGASAAHCASTITTAHRSTTVPSHHAMPSRETGASAGTLYKGGLPPEGAPTHKDRRRPPTIVVSHSRCRGAANAESSSPPQDAGILRLGSLLNITSESRSLAPHALPPASPLDQATTLAHTSQAVRVYQQRALVSQPIDDSQHGVPVYQSSATSVTPILSAANIDKESCQINSPGIDMDLSQSTISAGGSVGSGNIIGSSISMNPVNNFFSNEDPLRHIQKKLGDYVVSEALLKKAIHGDVSVCYTGTRETLLAEILRWVESPSEGVSQEPKYPRLARCIVGAPGSGKSTVLNTLITEHGTGIITAHYSIRRSIPSTTEHDKVLTTLVDQLSQKSPPIATRVAQLLDAVPYTGILARKFPEQLFLKTVADYEQTVFVIIDALDEASNPTVFAATLSRVIHKAPPNLRLLLATRNEHGVLANLGRDLVPSIVWSIPTVDSIQEVGGYIAARLQAGVDAIRDCNPAWDFWPDISQLRSLSERAGGLYIWARTAVDFILSRIQSRGLSHRDKWVADVGSVGMADVNRLYMSILEANAQDKGCAQDEMMMLVKMKEVLGFIITAERPVALGDMVGFLGIQNFDVRHFIMQNRSILVPGIEPITENTEPEVHKTLFDFLTSDRARLFKIHPEDYHRSAFRRCFEVMASHLRFNICNLRSSFKHNADVEDLAARVEKLPKGLVYASTQWGHHLGETGPGFFLSDLDHIKTLLYDKLLFWLEILSLKRTAFDGARDPESNWLHELGVCVARHCRSPRLILAEPDGMHMQLAIFAEEASQLVRRFKWCIRYSIPHIYISLLSFFPQNSKVARHYRTKILSVVATDPLSMPRSWDSWDSRRVTPRPTHTPLPSISFSPSGIWLASADTRFEVIKVWDVRTGECILKHTDLVLGFGIHRDHPSILSICFPSSGLLFAGFCSDQGLRVWNLETGELIRVWDTFTGEFIQNPSSSTELEHLRSRSKSRYIDSFGEHSISFLQDGTHIVCEAWKIVRIWNIDTGDCVIGPLRADTGIDQDRLRSPESVAFRLPSRYPGVVASSIDGAYIAFRYLNVVQLLDLRSKTHSPIIRQLYGHTGAIHSISFSSNCRRIASSSNDGSLRIWDLGAQDNASHNLRLINTQSADVVSLCFSPDGQYLASGSRNGVLCIWDVEGATCVAGPICVSRGMIYSLAFSPDRKCLAAASKAGAVRIWDFDAVLDGGRRTPTNVDEAHALYRLTDQTLMDEEFGGWTLGPKGELLFWTPSPFAEAIWRPSTIRVLGWPHLVNPDLSKLVTGEEWLDCWALGITNKKETRNGNRAG